jgi:hypothetical protein
MKNWRTTLIGTLFAAINMAYPLCMEGKVSTQIIIISAAFAAIGYLAKDAGVSGIEK